MDVSSFSVWCTASQEDVIFCMGADESFAALTVSLWTSMVVGGPWQLPGWEQAEESLPFSICFLRMKDKVWQQGVKWKGRQQLTCWLCLLKYHLTWKHEFLILTACFDRIFCVDKDLYNLPKFEPLQHQPIYFVVVLPCGACQRAGAEDCSAKGLSWPTKLDNGILQVVLEGGNFIPHCCKASKSKLYGSRSYVQIVWEILKWSCCRYWNTWWWSLWPSQLEPDDS